MRAWGPVMLDEVLRRCGRGDVGTDLSTVTLVAHPNYRDPECIIGWADARWDGIQWMSSRGDDS